MRNGKTLGIAMLVGLLASGCYSAIVQEEYVRLAVVKDIGSAKIPWTSDPVSFVRIGPESFLFQLHPEGRIGLARMEEIKDEIEGRMDGFVAGYRWALEHHSLERPNVPVPPAVKSPEAWRAGFARGYGLARREERILAKAR